MSQDSIAKIQQLLFSKDDRNIQLAIQLIENEQFQEQFYYPYRFWKMVEELRSNPNIVVKEEFCKAPDLDSILQVEKHWNIQLNPAVRRFYEQCDGFGLLWCHKNSDLFQSFNGQFASLTQQEDCSDGRIHIVDIFDAFLDYNLEYEYEVEVGDKEYEGDDIEKYFFKFDICGNFNEVVNFLGNDPSNPSLLMLDDYQACWTDSRLIDIPSYLELVFYAKGLTQARRHVLSKYNGHKLPVLHFDKAFFDQFPPISLDSIEESGEYTIPTPKSSFWSDEDDEDEE